MYMESGGHTSIKIDELRGSEAVQRSDMDAT